MLSGIFVRGRAGLVGLLVLALTAAPTLPVLGGGLFQRRARSHRSSVTSTGASWGSYGATGGGRVIYTQAQPLATHNTLAQRGGTYASHGAAGGSPQSHVIASTQRTAQAYYPSNRVVVRRTPVATATPSVATNQQPVNPAPIVPPAPLARVLKRSAYDETEVSLAGLYPERTLALLKSPVSSFARTTASRHQVMKPTTEIEIPSVLIKKDVDVPLEELPTDTDPQLPNLDAPTLEATERSVEKVETTRSVQTESSVGNLSVAVLEDATSLSPVEENEAPSEAAIAIDDTQTTLTDAALELPNASEVELDETVELEAVAEVESSEQPVVPDDIPANEDSDNSVQPDQPSIESLVGNLDQLVNEPTEDRPSSQEPEVAKPKTDLVDEKPTLTLPNQRNTLVVDESDVEPETSKVDQAIDEPIGLRSILVRHKQRETTPQPMANEPVPTTTPKRARLVLHVPESAEVFLMNRKMVTTGKTRQFNVPVNDPTKLHPYQIRVVTQRGVVVESTQQIRAGQRLELTFNDEAGTLALRPVQVSPFE